MSTVAPGVAAAPMMSAPSQADLGVLQPWLRRRDTARNDRRAYEIQWQINQFFAAGVQWLATDIRNGRVLYDRYARDHQGRPFDVVDVLSQYTNTAIGKLAQGDLRPELLCQWPDDDLAEEYTDELNRALDYAWREECKGDRRLIGVLRSLAELGTGAIRVRYDRSKGKLVATDVPHENGQPLLDEADQVRYMHQRFVAGMEADLRPLREGMLAWEKLSAWNLLPPPGVDDPADFPWELIVRPVYLPLLKSIYGAKAADVRADKIEEMGMLAYSASRFGDQGWGWTAGSPAVVSRLQDHALVYTGYLRPDNQFPNGQTVVFSHDGHLLEQAETLPLQDDPWGPRSGITYFRWQVLEGRFWGRSFMEPGIGPQKTRNRRVTQINHTIDAGQPKVYATKGSVDPSKMKGMPLEVVYVEPGNPLPQQTSGVEVGSWMFESLTQGDNDVKQALGLNETSLGNSPSGVSAYSAMALISENDAVKLEPVAQDFRLGVAEVVRDTIELMRQWPAGKQLLIADPGSAAGHLRSAAFDAKKSIPSAFLVRPAPGGALPRSQAAEIQKIVDVVNYAATVGAAQQNPTAWLDFYVHSLNAGELQALPPDPSGSQIHKAALENGLMASNLVVLPVADYDDPNVHVPEHRSAQADASIAAEAGDVQAIRLVQVLEQHIQLHEAQGEANAQTAPGVPPPAGGPASIPLPQPRYIDQLQTPRPPNRGF